MRIPSVCVTVFFACVCAAGLDACSSYRSAMPATSAVLPERTGVAPAFFYALRFGTAMPNVVPAAGGAPRLLAVTDFGTLAVEILSSDYHFKKRITKGVSGPDGDWYDAAGNLYVANYVGVNVQEYKKGTKIPSFTYSTGLKDPIDVTTDEAGNVYVSDYSMGGNGFVSEYGQGSNTVKARCSPGGAPEGVAVDEAGDVFVAYNASSAAHIAEYSGGLSGCNETILGATLGFAGGLQIDKKNKLVACDQKSGVVDVIAPPYSAVTSSIGGFADPLFVALNAANTIVFVADVANGDVAVDAYPAGTNMATLGPANGLSEPAGVAVSPPEK